MSLELNKLQNDKSIELTILCQMHQQQLLNYHLFVEVTKVSLS